MISSVCSDIQNGKYVYFNPPNEPNGDHEKNEWIIKPVNPLVTLARIKSQLELKCYRDQVAGMVKEKTSQVKISQKLLREREQNLSKAEDHLKESEASAQSALPGWENRIWFPR